jgi:hypothetical protein
VISTSPISTNGTLYALDASNGNVIWRYTVPRAELQIGSNELGSNNNDLESSPAVANGVVYVSSNNGTLYALNATNGYQLWNYPTDGGLWSSPAVVDGVVYSGSLFALSASSASTPTPTPMPTPTSLTTIVPATTGNGSSVDLAISGNITSVQMSNVTIATSQSANTTTVSFAVTGESGTTGFGNITIPKTAVPYGTAPTIYIDSQPAQNQGYTQDTNNYYVWYTTHFSTHQITVVFTKTPHGTLLPAQSPLTSPKGTSGQSSLIQVIYGVAAGVAIVAIVTASLMVIINDKKHKPKGGNFYES